MLLCKYTRSVFLKQLLKLLNLHLKQSLDLVRLTVPVHIVNTWPRR